MNVWIVLGLSMAIMLQFLLMDRLLSQYLPPIFVSCFYAYLYLYKNIRITLAGRVSGMAYNDAAGLPQHGYIALWLPASV